MPGNPRGRPLRCISPSNEAGRRRAIGVVATPQSSTARPRRWCDAGSPSADQKAGAPGRRRTTHLPAYRNAPLPRGHAIQTATRLMGRLEARPHNDDQKTGAPGSNNALPTRWRPLPTSLYELVGTARLGRGTPSLRVTCWRWRTRTPVVPRAEGHEDSPSAQSLSPTGRFAGDRITGLNFSRTPPREMLSM